MHAWFRIVVHQMPPESHRRAEHGHGELLKPLWS